MRVDFHLHSNISLDSPEPMENIIQAAIDRGFDLICLTDHCDLIQHDVPGVSIGASSFAQWQRSYAEIARMRDKFGDQIEILHGMELAEIPQDPEQARFNASQPDLDFIIGSIHATSGVLDYHFLDYPDEAFCMALADVYLDENIRMAEMDLTDVLGHIGFINRYIVRAGLPLIDFMQFEEKLRHLFKILVENGRGIEVNTSGLRQQGMGAPFPDLPILRLYKECGGEIVTIGSDAHRAADVGLHFDKACEILQTAGFRYQTIFRQRKPAFIPL